MAVLAVIVYHLNRRWLPGGFSGVDVFFVISGFVVSVAQSRRAASTFWGFATQFYARRIQRIVPALLVCIVTVSVASVAVIPYSWLAGTNGTTALYALVGLSNVALVRSNADYFAPRTEYNPFTHTWSLGVEEQFYLAFPILFFLWAAGRTNRSRALSTLAFGILLVASIVTAWWLASRNPTLAYYTIFTRFWELAVGVLLYHATVLKRGFFAGIGWRARGAGVAASLLLLCVGFAWARPNGSPYPWGFAPVLATAGLLALLGDGPPGVVRRLLSGRSLVFLGRASYSLYLWHWPVVVLLRWTIGMESMLSYLIAIVATFVLAIVSFRFVESPFRYSAVLRRQPKLVVIAGGLVAVAFCCAFTYELFQHQQRFSLSVTRTALWDDEGAYLGKGPCPLHLTQSKIQGGLLRRMAPECGTGEPRGRLIMVGDSHAGRYVPLLQRFSRDTGTTVMVYGKLGCSYLGLFGPDRDAEATCREFTAAVTAELRREARRGDVVFLPSLRVPRLANVRVQSASRSTSDARTTRLRAAAVTEAADQLRTLAENGVHVVFEAPKPIFRVPPFRCADWFTRANPICRSGLEMSRAYLLAYRQPVMQSYSVLATQVDGLRVWDPFPILCPTEPCKAMVNGMPLFFDEDHVAGYGNMQLYPHFKKFFMGLLGELATEDGSGGKP